MAERRWSVLGVPSSRAAHWPGIEQGPSAWRAAGLVDALRAGGLPVRDLGDRPVARWRPEAPPAGGAGRAADRPHDVAGVLEVLRDAADALAPVVDAGETPLVLGGECTVLLALVAATLTSRGDVGVVYVDGGQDLQLPADHPEEPILDSMGVAHLLDLPGVVDDLAGLGPRRPMLAPDALCFVGFGDDEEDVHGLVPSVRLPASAVVADPAAAAGRAARTASAGGGGRFLVHLDVDVLDALRLPGPDIPQYGRGLTLDVLAALLDPLVHSPGFAGMALVEYNPDHDPDGTSVRRLVAGLGPVLATP